MIAAAIQLIVLMAVFTLVESCWPSSRKHHWWRRPLLVDLCAWAVHPLSVAAGIALAISSSDALLALVPPAGVWKPILHGREHLAALPLFVQTIVALILMDFLSYWIHRAYHRFSFLWAFHVVHHSSEELDWLSTSRLHPLSQMLDTWIMSLVLFLAGLPISAIIGANVVIGAAALVAHANVRWTFGPLQRLFISPLVHQWHHALTTDEKHKNIGNYGAVFSIWDRLFGTWSLPSGNRPASFGTPNSPPTTVIGLAFYPLRACVRAIQTWVQKVRPTKIAKEDFAKYAAEQGIADEQGLKQGMPEKSREFVEKGVEVYAKV